MTGERDVQRLVVPHLQGPEFLDGALEAPAWDQAARMNLEIEQGGSHPPENPTEVYVFHDGVWLYVGWRCHDPDISDLQMKKRTLQMDTCDGDSVRLWLDAALLHHKQHIFEFQIDPHGSKYQLQGGLRGWPYMDMYGVEHEARIQREAGCWTAETRILLSEVGIDLSRSNLIGFNVGRAFRGKQIYSWMESDGEVATGWGFATLDIGDKALTERSLQVVEVMLKKSKQTEALPDAPGKYRVTNAEVGASLFGPPNQPTLWIGKSDVWDRRLLRKDVPLISLKELKEAAFSGSTIWSDAAIGNSARSPFGMRSNVKRLTPEIAELQRRNDWYGAYTYPGPKPVGQVIVGLPFDERECTADVRETVEFRCVSNTFIKAANEIEVRSGEQTIRLRVYLRPRTNVIVVEGHAENMVGEEIWIRVFRHRDTLRAGPAFAAKYNEHYDYMSDAPKNRPLEPPTAKAGSGVISVAQDLPADPTFPEGFRVVLAGGVSGAEVVGNESQQVKMGLGTLLRSNPISCYAPNWRERFNDTPGSTATLRVRLQKDFLAAFAVVTTRDDPEPDSAAERLVSETLAMSQDDLRAEYSQAERKDYIGGYNYNSDIPMCTTGGLAKFCYDDGQPWHGDFHFNEMASSFPAIFIRGLHGDIEPYYQMVEHAMPMARRYARAVFDCDGAAFPITHYPLKMDTLMQSSVDWDFSMKMTAEVMKPFWMHYLYTGDRTFLEKHAYPVLHDGARFYAEFVTLEDDGCYHVVPSTSDEHWVMMKEFMLDRDPQCAVTLIKYHLNACARAAEILGLDAEEAAHWRDIAAHLPPYATAQTQKGRVFVDAPGTPYIKHFYNVASHLAAVIWGDEITQDSPPELIETARRTAEDYLDHPIGRPAYAVQALARLGIYVEGETFVPGGRILVEKLLQSHAGVLRVFPAVPKDHSERFEDYRAEGAFSVTAEMENGKITRLEITSKVGNPCCLARPWSGKVRVLDADTGADVPAEVGPKYVTFDTLPAKTYRIAREPGKEL